LAQQSIFHILVLPGMLDCKSMDFCHCAAVAEGGQLPLKGVFKKISV